MIGRVGQGIAIRVQRYPDAAVMAAAKVLLGMGTTKAAKAVGLSVGAFDWHLRLGKPNALERLAVRYLDRQAEPEPAT